MTSEEIRELEPDEDGLLGWLKFCAKLLKEAAAQLAELNEKKEPPERAPLHVQAQKARRQARS